MKLFSLFISISFFLFPPAVWATVFGSIRGVVHDPDHRPVKGARVVVKSSSSDYAQTAATGADGDFEVVSLPVGAYQVTVTQDGFGPSVQETVVGSGGAPILQFQLAIGTVRETVNVAEAALAVNPDQMTPATMIRSAER